MRSAATRRRRARPRCACRIDAGSLEEADDQRGLAHFIEHMAFNGSTHVAEGEFVHRLERLGLRFGADTNAGTEFTQTVYKLDLPESDPAKLDEAMFLLREVAGEVSFAPAAIDRERGIIQSEERTRATPGYRIFVDQLSYLLRGQLVPQRIPIGIPEVIANARRARFAAFYDAYYRPERATLIAAGDFDLDADGGQDPRPLRQLAGPRPGRAQPRSRRGRAAAHRGAADGRAGRPGAGRSLLGAPGRFARPTQGPAGPSGSPTRSRCKSSTAGSSGSPRT